jgi:hypothetical protein
MQPMVFLGVFFGFIYNEAFAQKFFLSPLNMLSLFAGIVGLA